MRLNLLDDDRTIEQVIEKGKIAGEKIVNDFKLEHHQWVRFQVMMGMLETELTKIEQMRGEMDCETLAREQEDKNNQYSSRRSRG